MRMSAAAVPVRKPRSPRTTLTKLRRQEILDAAVKVFSRKGFESARAEDIAHAAKIAKGTLYLYFRSKEALYSAAIAHAVEEVQVQAMERIAAAEGLPGKLGAAIAVRLGFWTEHQTIYRLLLTLGREPRHRRQTTELLRSGQQHFAGLFEDGVRSGELPDGDYAALAWAILDMIRGATERRMDRPGEVAIEADTEAITRFALRSAGLRSMGELPLFTEPALDLESSGADPGSP